MSTESSSQHGWLVNPALDGGSSSTGGRAKDAGGEEGLSSSVDEDEVDVSCIGARKQCIQDTRCSGLLNDYRNYCRYNKRTNQCITTEW